MKQQRLNPPTLILKLCSTNDLCVGMQLKVPGWWWTALRGSICALYITSKLIYQLPVTPQCGEWGICTWPRAGLVKEAPVDLFPVDRQLQNHCSETLQDVEKIWCGKSPLHSSRSCECDVANGDRDANEKMGVFEKKTRVFREHAVKRAAVHIETQRMTPKRSKEIGAAYLKKLGLCCPWGTPDFTEKGGARTVDAHLPTCACCGFRNTTINFGGGTPEDGAGLDGTKWFDGTKGLERSHRDIDLSDPEMQAVLKMDNDRLQTDSQDTDKRRRGRLRPEHLASMREDALEIPISDDRKTNEVELWRLHSAWPDKTPVPCYARKGTSTHR